MVHTVWIYSGKVRYRKYQIYLLILQYNKLKNFLKIEFFLHVVAHVAIDE